MRQRKQKAKLWRGVNELDNLLGVDEQLEEEDLRKLFDDIDTDGNGTLDREELKTVLKSMGRDDKTIGKVISNTLS